MLKTRLITAGFFIVFIVYIFSFAPQSWFNILYVGMIFLAILRASTEFIALRWGIMDGPSLVELPKPELKFKHYAIGFAYAFPVIIYAFCQKSSSIYLQTHVLLLLLAWLFFSILTVIICLYKNADDIQTVSHKFLNVLAGFIYIGLPGLCALKLIEFPEIVRCSYVYFVLATIHMGDAGGYFIGTKFGKHKLVPKVSPKKSVEGALGGLLFSACTALFVKLIFNLPFSVGFALTTGILLGLAGQLGDLIESAFKRAGGFKDSGTLLPGHGGLLDRIDSLCLGLPVAFILFALVL